MPAVSIITALSFGAYTPCASNERNFNMKTLILEAIAGALIVAGLVAWWVFTN